MFESLSERFSSALRRLSGRGRISEQNVREAMQEVRTALLEADVQQDVVDSFCAEVLSDALGTEVLASLTPAQEMVGIVHRRLVELMGPAAAGLPSVEPGPTVVLMCGLQGSGKTTTCGKLAAWLRKRGRSVMLAACDLQRPAAVDQLRIVAESVAADAPGTAAVAFHGEPEKCAEIGRAVGVAVGVATRALARARAERIDTLIIDTAGRLHIDEDLMRELAAIDAAVQPHERIFVVDAMTGQDAVRSAKAFHQRLALDGVIVTKFDSDTRGGATLSVRRVTGAPIRFVGISERWDGLEEFHPERVAGRILGMGDVVSLVEKAQAEVSEAEAQDMADKLAKGRFTMDDFLKQMRMLRRMGSMKQLLGMLPGVGQMLKDVNIDDAQFDRVEGMVHSMTPREREDVAVIDRSRARRIASGSGTQPHEVSRLAEQFRSMSRMTQQMAKMGPGEMSKAMAGMGAMPGVGGMPGLRTKGSTRTESVKARFKKRR